MPTRLTRFISDFLAAAGLFGLVSIVVVSWVIAGWPHGKSDGGAFNRLIAGVVATGIGMLLVRGLRGHTARRYSWALHLLALGAGAAAVRWMARGWWIFLAAQSSPWP